MRIQLKAVPLKRKTSDTWPLAIRIRGWNHIMISWFTVKPMLGARGINHRNIPMMSKLLISTAALLAGIAVASAQNMPGGGGGQSGGAVQDKPGQAQPGSQPSTKNQREQRGHMDQTTGQVPQE